MATSTQSDLAKAQHQTAQMSPLVLELANRYQMTAGTLWNAIVQTIVPQGATAMQVMAFLAVANQYKLNPFLKQIYAFPTKGGGIVPMVPVDGWIDLVQKNDQWDGVEFEYHWEDGSTGPVQPKGKDGKSVQINAITCKMHRKGKAMPTAITEYFAECNQDSKEPWKKWPVRMLRHKALIQCARVAFGFSGIYDEDEAERIAEAGGTVIPKGGGGGPLIEGEITVPQVSADKAAALRERISNAQQGNGGTQQNGGGEPTQKENSELGSSGQSTSAPATKLPQDQDPYIAQMGENTWGVTATVVEVTEPKKIKGGSQMVSVKLKDDTKLSCFHASLFEHLQRATGKECIFYLSKKGEYWHIEKLRKIGTVEFDGDVPVVQSDDVPQFSKGGKGGDEHDQRQQHGLPMDDF
jgi:phage recombination protein Bet